MFVNSVGEGRKGGKRGKRGKERGRERARAKKDFYKSYFALEPSRSGVLLCICEKRGQVEVEGGKERGRERSGGGECQPTTWMAVV